MLPSPTEPRAAKSRVPPSTASAEPSSLRPARSRPTSNPRPASRGGADQRAGAARTGEQDRRGPARSMAGPAERTGEQGAGVWGAGGSKSALVFSSGHCGGGGGRASTAGEGGGAGGSEPPSSSPSVTAAAAGPSSSSSRRGWGRERIQGYGGRRVEMAPATSRRCSRRTGSGRPLPPGGGPACVETQRDGQRTFICVPRRLVRKMGHLFGYSVGALFCAANTL